MNGLRDLHIHIEGGEYSLEWIDRFVSQAVKMDLSEINLLEHSVRIKEFHKTFADAEAYNLYQRQWVAEKRRTAKSLDEYISLIENVKSREYPIKISFGLEICWFEQYEREIAQLAKSYPFDYLLGSVHWIDNWTFNQRKYQWKGRNINQIYKRYFELQESLVQSGIFDVCAHPDLIMCHSLYPDYDLTEAYQSLCRTAKQNSVALELNSARGKSIGINEDFFNIAVREGVSFTAGSDAHSPQDTGKGIKEICQRIDFAYPQKAE